MDIPMIEKNQHPNDTMGNKYNWVKIKREYVEGYVVENNEQIWPTMKQLSIKYGCPQAYLRRIAANQKWVIEKTNYVTNYEHAKQTEKIRYLSKKSAKFDGRCIKLAEEGVEKVENLFTRIKENLITTDGVRILISLEDLELAAKILERFQKIGRLALGSSTENVSKAVKTSGDLVSFSDGLNTIMQQIESNPELMKKLETEFLDEE